MGGILSDLGDIKIFRKKTVRTEDLRMDGAMANDPEIMRKAISVLLVKLGER